MIDSGSSKSTNMTTTNGPSHNDGGVPIAIIGMSCRFAGEATDPSKLWDLCKRGEDAWSPIPEERFDAAGLYDKRKESLGRVSDSEGMPPDEIPY